MSEAWGENGSGNFSSEEKGFGGFAAVPASPDSGFLFCGSAVVVREVTFTRNKQKRIGELSSYAAASS